MPVRAKRPCSQPGCGKLADSRYCQEHARLADDETRQRKAQHDRHRGSSTQRGYGSRWQRYRKAYLTEHPLCAECMKAGRTTLATVVDHRETHHGNPDLFWDTENHQPLCKRCHDRKTAARDGGFGNRRN